MTIDTAWKIAAAIFGAGIIFAGIRQMRKDLTGVGNRGRAEAERNDFRFLTQFVDSMIHQNDEVKREKIGKRFLDAWQGRR